MKRLAILAAVLAGCGASSPLDDLRSDDPERAAAAAEAFLARGKAAIPELREALTEDDARLRKRVRGVLSKLTGQWGSDGTGILWKTSFDAAVAEAKRLDRPILVLNLFGRFDQEFC
jgi:hypothetical protein